MSNDKPIGQPFTNLYTERGEPLADRPTFRRRIGHYCQDLFNVKGRTYNHDLGKYLIMEMGIEMPQRGFGYDLELFFVQTSINNVLNAITFVWRFASEEAALSGSYLDRDAAKALAEKWFNFVQRALREENMNYTVDAKGGVHYRVDEEFQRNRQSLLRYLEAPKYAGIRAAFEDAHKYLDDHPPDTKAAVRSIFESIEIMAKLLVPTAQRLNKSLVTDYLKPLVLKTYNNDSIARATIEQVFDGLALWVNALHNYRHGQRSEDPVSPPLDFTIYVLSSGASILRWLLDIDNK